MCPTHEIGDVGTPAKRSRQQFTGTCGHRMTGGADSGVLAANEVAGLGTPGEQFCVERQPVSIEPIPQVGGSNRVPGALDDPRLPDSIGEERSPGSGVHSAANRVVDVKPTGGDLSVTTHDDDGTRTHALLFADDLRYSGAPIRAEGLGWVLEKAEAVGSGCRGHGRRQVDEPARVNRPVAHNFERGCGTVGTDSDTWLEASVDNPSAEHIGGIEQRPVPFRVGRNIAEWFDRLPVRPRRSYRNQLAFGISQRCELAAEHASGVYTDRVVDPFRVGHRSVAVYNDGRAAVVVGPRIANRKSELVGLPV